MNKLAVIALGGNSLIKDKQAGTIDEQEANVLETCENLFQLISNNYNIVITHGNGPQVGNILLQNQAGAKMYGMPEMPLDICGAYSQGFIGYMIEQQLRNVLEKNKLDRDVITIVTQVLVDKKDPAFTSPTKPIGPYYTKEEADKIAEATSAVFAEDPKGRGWRKVVASPQPINIFNQNTIEKISKDGQVVVAVGGGGIPAFYVEPNKLQGIDAVIDKDLASSLLAANIKADVFFILTDVDKVYINFRKDNEQAIDEMTVAEAKKYLDEGQFAKGSMAPKVAAAINFVERSGKSTIITKASELGKSGAGTRIIA